jgi:hypothetical protein
MQICIGLVSSLNTKSNKNMETKIIIEKVAFRSDDTLQSEALVTPLIDQHLQEGWHIKQLEQVAVDLLGISRSAYLSPSHLILTFWLIKP